MENQVHTNFSSSVRIQMTFSNGRLGLRYLFFSQCKQHLHSQTVEILYVGINGRQNFPRLSYIRHNDGVSCQRE